MPAPKSVGHRSFHTRRQFLPYTCGSVTATMLLGHYGLEISPVVAALWLRTNPVTGTTFDRLAEALRTVGLRVRTRSSAQLPDLRRTLARCGLVLPSVDGNHVGVLWKLTEDHAYFSDPSPYKGPRVRVALSTFLRRWDGEALLVTPGRLRCGCPSSRDGGF